MGTAKLRCTVCRVYRQREDFYKASSLEKVCSEECFIALRNRRRSSTGGSGNHSQRSFSKRKPASPRHPMPPGRRDEVLARDGSNCRFCRKWKHLHVHHINYKSQGVDHQAHNLITLCSEHHELVHSNKKLYQPVLRAVIWEQYVNGRYVTVPQMMRRLD